MNDFRKLIHKKTKKKILYSIHTLNQMNKPKRMISKDEIRNVLTKGEIIEDYPDDERGHSCLLSGRTIQNRTIHVVCSPKEEYLLIITTYIPDEKKWSNNFKKRKED